MARRTTPHPTEAELEILRILWDGGPGTVRDIQQALGQIRPTGYTTALKHLQLMSEKGLVIPDKSRRAHVYRAGISEAEAQEQIVGNLLDKVFDGSTSTLLLRALSSRETPAEELAEIRDLLDRMEGDTP